MAKNKGTAGGGALGVKAAEEKAQRVADELGMELVEVLLQKESRGKCLLIFIDKEGGLSLDDCERYHKAVQLHVENVDYDFLEVSSPGIDRPIKTLRDFEKNAGQEVELKLFAAKDGVKLFYGALTDMTDTHFVLTNAKGEQMAFERKAVAVVKPVIVVDEDDEMFTQIEQ